MLHNEDIYPEPFEFNPDRFMKDGKLDTAVKDPAHAAFGFGRRWFFFPRLAVYRDLSSLSSHRICPARYMAFSAVWIAIASMAAVFDITKAIDENGEVVEPSQEYETGLVW